MKAYTLGTQEGVASLALVDKPSPTPSPGEAVVGVAAVCLNHRDLLTVSGRYGARRPEDRTPGSDGVGVVTAVGEGVTTVALGDRVTCGHFVTWLDGAFQPSVFGVDLGVTRDGWLAERVAIPAAALVKVPAALSDAQAAPLPSAGLTAWQAVVEVGRVRAGETVLVLGTGGVSMMAMQIARIHGARVVVTSSSDAKLEAARTLGAQVGVNYRSTPDWAKAVLEATGGRGADIVVETGGSETLTHSIAAAAPNGRIVVVGSLSGGFAVEVPNFASLIGKNLTLRGIAAGSRRMLAELVEAAALAGLTPPIDRVFPFAEARAAYEHLATGSHLGKVMIKLRD